MYYAKVSASHAESARKAVMEMGILDATRKVDKDDHDVYFPILSPLPPDLQEALAEEDMTIVEREGSLRPRQATFKERIEDIVPKSQRSRIKTSFDSVGTVAIMEIDDDVFEFAVPLAEALLETNKHIKTVLRKSGAHEGEFRTQAMEFIAGEKKTTAIVKENGVSLSLDVSRVYYSVRMSTERKRIASLITWPENVLVLFSGCGPYPCVVAKNTPANFTLAIEKNPDGNKWANKNLIGNKVDSTAAAYCEDVATVMPHLIQKMIGLKSHWNPKQLKKRLALNPCHIEYHLFNDDLDKKLKSLKKAIDESPVPVYLHVPFKSKGQFLHLCKEDISEEIKVWDILENLCKKHKNCKGFIAHAVTEDADEKEKDPQFLVKNLKFMNKRYNYHYVENGSGSIFSKTKDILKIVKETETKRMTFDLSHAFMVNGSIQKVIEMYDSLRRKVSLYCHVNDGTDKQDSVEIGQGDMDLDLFFSTCVVPHGTMEVMNTDEENPEELERSYEKLKKFPALFDRVIMPMPKGGDCFIGYSLQGLKPGGMLHYYDFLPEDEGNRGVQKIRDASLEAGFIPRLRSITPCGTPKPHWHRFCIDMEMDSQLPVPSRNRILQELQDKLNNKHEN